MKIIRTLSLAALAAALTASASAFPNTNPPYAGYVTADEFGSRNAQLAPQPEKGRTIAVFAEGRRVRHQGKAASNGMRPEMGNAGQGNQR